MQEICWFDLDYLMRCIMTPLQQAGPGRTNASSHCIKISHLLQNQLLGKMAILDEGNKSQHAGSTYGGTKYQMPKEGLMLFVGLLHRKHAYFMLAGSNKFIAQNKMY